MTDQIVLLDVGPNKYGDASLVSFGGRNVLIDGAHPGRQKGDARHPSLPDQIVAATGGNHVDLIVVSHAHRDHTGCLPHLIKHGTLTCDWAFIPDPNLAWGRPAGGEPIDTGADLRVRQVLAALHEQPLSRSATDEEVAAFLADARTDEDRYREMLELLEAQDSKVVRFGRDPLEPMLEAFKDIGLNVIGPPDELLLTLARLIEERTRQDFDALMSFAATDSVISPADMYRRAVFGGNLDSLDSQSRPGFLVNLQSSIITFTHDGHSALFAGDMQFTDPQFGSASVPQTVAELRAAVANAAPFDFVKLSHHGSPNAFDESVLAELGESHLFGIIAGEDSEEHPHHQVLDLLRRTPGIRWARTDRNGSVQITFDGDQPSVMPTRGRLNDPRSNLDDLPAPESPPPLGAGTVVVPETQPGAAPFATARQGGEVEVVMSVPAGVRAVLTVDVDGQVSSQPVPIASPFSDTRGVGPFQLAGGRQLPNLLWVTNPTALANNIGATETAVALASVRAAGQRVLDDMPPPSKDPRAALAVVQDAVTADPTIDGIVILGGYDVVPSTRFDSLPADLRAKVGAAGDPDNWIVWCDDPFGDRDGNQVSDIPVSRVPDAHSARLVFSALTAGPRPQAPLPSGIRNSKRPFADDVFTGLLPNGALLQSAPHSTHTPAGVGIDGRNVYLMLHGDWEDGSRFWGESDNGKPEAVNIGQIVNISPDVVLSGCCWGALITAIPASRVTLSQSTAHKTPDASIALRFLAAGARAYVGCTGAHYSPTQQPYTYFGEPLHRRFWGGIASGTPPAQALFDAKRDYVAGIPHRNPKAGETAVELKIWRQFTCLGIGW